MFKEQLTTLANELIRYIKEKSDFFSSTFIVFPTKKMEQWFKSYWLKTQGDKVLMNIKCLNMNEAIGEMIYTSKPYSVIKVDTIKHIIIKLLTTEFIDKLPKEEKDYIFVNNHFDSVKLYDYASKLGELFFEYSNDDFKLTGYQKELYDLVNAEADNNYQGTLEYIYRQKIHFKKRNEPLNFFGFYGFNNIEKKIIEDYQKENEVNLFLLKKEEENKVPFTVISAPSKIREIEAIHSEICKRLKDKDVKYSDFLIVATNIKEYETTIERVFKQDNKDFPSIPYVISAYEKKDSDLTAGLLVLYDIFSKGFMTRLDFFKLVNNSLIQEVRGISKDDVTNFMKAIVELNVYRNNDKFDDWDYIKKRLVLSKVSDMNSDNGGLVALPSGFYLPYTNISFDNNAIARFVKIIDDVKSYLKTLRNIKGVDSYSLEKIKNELDKWFSILDEDDMETSKQYLRITNLFNNWNELDIANNDIPLNAFFYAIIDASKENNSTSGDLFTKGITFINFSKNDIYSVKYIFFLNASSKNLPSKVIKSELDQSEYGLKQTERERNTFFLLYQNTLEHFYISYINRDLKTDEEFFPSTFINELENREGIKGEKIEIEIDEKRPWSELFTKKEYKNKDYYIGLLTHKEEDEEEEDIPYSQEDPKQVTTKELSKYLEDPIIRKASRLFGKVDELDEDIRDEYEPFLLSSLDHYILCKIIIEYVLIKRISLDDEDLLNRIKNGFILEHALPLICEPIKEASFIDLVESSKATIELINTKASGDYEVKRLDPLLINVGDSSWVLSCSEDFVLHKENDGLDRTYFPITKISDKKGEINKNIKEMLVIYVISLMDIASMDNDETYHISLVRSEELIATFDVNRDTAIRLLDKIYKSYNDYSSIQMINAKLIGEKDFETYRALIDNVIAQRGSWDYYADKKMFNYERDFGYDFDTFKEAYQKAKEELMSLLLFVTKEEEGEENE